MKYFTAFLCLILSFSLCAQNGYEIKITLKPFKNQWVYLGHYFGKQLPIVDSVKLDDKSEGVLKVQKNWVAASILLAILTGHIILK